MVAPSANARGECEQQQQQQQQQQQLSSLLQTDGSGESAGPTATAAVTSSADAAGACSRREGVAPAMFAAAPVSARTVSASEPVVTQHGLPRATAMMTGNVGSSNARSRVLTSGEVGHARRGSRRGFTSSSDGPRRGVLPSFQEAVAAAAAAAAAAGETSPTAPARAQGSSTRRSDENEDSEDQREQNFREMERGGMERARGLDQGERGDHHPSAVQGSSGLRFALAGGAGEDRASTGSVMEPNYSDGESSSPGSSGSGSGGDASSDPVVAGSPPEEIRRVLASSHNTIALLLLLLLHYMVTHILGIAAFVVGTVVLVALDRRLRSHADAQAIKSRFVLLGVAVTAVFVVVVSAKFLSNFPGGEGLLCRLILVAPKPDLGTLSAVVCTTVVVDLWARHLSIAVKAFLAIVSVPEGSRGSEGSSGGAGGGSNSNSSGLCGRGRLAGCGHSSYRCRRRLGCLRRGGGTEGWGGLRRSPHPRGGGSSMFDTDDNTRGDGSGGSSNARGDGVNGTRFSGGVRRVWRTCLCFSERFCGGPFRLWCRPTSGSDGDGGIGGRQDGRADAADIRRAGVLLSRAGRQRRVYAIVEMVSLLYRCLLPVPVWMEFYSKDGDYFAAIYLVLKGLEASFRTDRLVRAACYIRRGDLDRGKFATPEEVSEVGSPDCSICYDRMERPLILPCNHIFCGECVAEWLEQERTCPLCRAEVPTSNPIPKALRDGRTAIMPQIL
ncbi:unnamed protein product [Pylaiella littoralis]